MKAKRERAVSIGEVVGNSILPDRHVKSNKFAGARECDQRSCGCACTFTNTTGLRNQIAEHVTAVVGLREALTSEYRPLQWFWLFLLLAGMAATILHIFLITQEYLAHPTATVVKLERTSDYEYPPTLLCPKSWVDTGKALAMGVSLDALQYSLGYFELDDYSISLQNVTKGRQEFLQFFNASKLPSLVSFYESIAVDLQVQPSDSKVLTTAVPSYFCNGCEHPAATKTVWDSSVCYRSQFAPLKKASLKVGQRRVITMSLENRSNGLIQQSANWLISLCASSKMEYSACVTVMVKDHYETKVKFSIQKISYLNTATDPCVHRSPGDSAVACVSRCENKVFQKFSGCQLLSATPDSTDSPASFCNYLDERLPLLNQSLIEVFSSNYSDRQQLEYESIAHCGPLCPPSCDKWMYEATVLTEYDFNRDDIEGDHVTWSNWSVFKVEVVHSGPSTGGILTWTEGGTYSTAQLISNFGGALGLFVGATIMTIAQVILFIVGRVVEKLKK